MPYVSRDASGNINGVFANLQSGYAEEFLPDDDPELVAYLNPPKITVENTSDFIARFTNQEYAKLGNVRLLDAQASKVGLSKNWDIVVLADTIVLSNQKAQTLKADLIAAGVLTPARADAIFS